MPKLRMRPFPGEIYTMSNQQVSDEIAALQESYDESITAFNAVVERKAETRTDIAALETEIAALESERANVLIQIGTNGCSAEQTARCEHLKGEIAAARERADDLRLILSGIDAAILEAAQAVQTRHSALNLAQNSYASERYKAASAALEAAVKEFLPDVMSWAFCLRFVKSSPADILAGLAYGVKSANIGFGINRHLPSAIEAVLSAERRRNGGF